MTDRENRIIHALIHPGECKHEFGTWGLDLGYCFCKNCREQVRADQLYYELRKLDYTSDSGIMEVLRWLSLPEQSDLFRGLRHYLWQDPAKAAQFMLNLVPNLLSYLATPEAQERFGYEDCTENCEVACDITRKECPNNPYPGRIKRPWLIEIEKEG